MKKLLKYILAASFSFLLIFGSISNIYGADASLTGPSTVRAGDTLTLNLKISDSGKYGVEGTLVYDSNQVTLSSVSTNLSGWKTEQSGNTIIAYDDALANPLSGTKTVMTLVFKVNSTVATGTAINISVDGILVSDGNNETHLGTANYSKTVAAPLSNNANLASLSVTGATLSPAFKAGTTSYSIGEVEYATSKLDIKYTLEDSKAKAEVKGNSLSVGSNTVSITVTAEDGSTKTYKISVTRKQDPNYKANSNAALKTLTISHGLLSPTFSAEVTDYIVYLPYECAGTKFTASGTAANAKAQGVTSGTIDKLAEGTNKTTVVCKAEDGTEKSYAITVVVMPKYDGKVPAIGESTGGNEEPIENPTENPTESPTEPPTEEPSTGTESDSEKDSESSTTPKESNNGILVTILVIVVVLALVGALVYVLFFSNRKF